MNQRFQHPFGYISKQQEPTLGIVTFVIKVAACRRIPNTILPNAEPSTLLSSIHPFHTMSKSSRKSIVVVGGGAAGATITRILSAKIDANTTSLTLVTARPFALHLPAAIRMTTSAEDKLEESVLIPYDSLLVKGNGTVKVGRVTGIEQGKEGKDGSVVLSTGERIHYDFLVLAPGAEWDGPLALPDDRAAVLEHIRSWRRKFENAKTGIVLAGGGAVSLGRFFCLSHLTLTFMFSLRRICG
jgi:hypothetical protein